MLNIRRVFLTSVSQQQLGLAEKKLLSLKKKLNASNLSFGRDYFRIDAVNFILKIEGDFAKILAFGGASLPHILLTSDSQAKAYDWYSDKLSKASVVPDATSGRTLVPIYNGRLQLDDYAESTFNKKWSSSLIDNQYKSLGGLNDYEMGVFANDQEIYGRIGDTIGHIATVPDTFLSDFAKPYGSLFSLPAYKVSPAWNLFRGLILYSLNPANQSVQDSWYWVPSFFTVPPGDAYSLKPGFYYGKYPASKYDGENALTSAKVSFKALLDTRHTGGDYNYGWCELVRDINGTTVNELHFYLQSTVLTVPANPTFGDLRIAGTTADQSITTGSHVTGFDSVLALPLTIGTVEPIVEMWNFQIWTDPDALATQQDSGVCIAFIGERIAQFARFSGYLSTVYESSTYHSHSTSRDGSILAVFESDDGNLIARVRVFDLFGTRMDVGVATYSAGGFTEIIASETVASVEALTGCIIPYRVEGFEPIGPTYDLATASPLPDTVEDYTLWFSAIAIVHFLKQADGPPTIQKVICSNGVDAEFGISIDTCFDSVMIVEDKGATSEEKLVGTWDGGGTLQGRLRGDFSGLHPNMKFNGVGEGWYTVTRPGTFSITLSEQGVLSFDGYIGDLIIGSCIILDGNDYKPDPACGGCAQVTASSSCGQNALLTTAPATALSITGTVDCDVDEVYTASGGCEDYTYSFDDGTIDSSGKILTVTPTMEVGQPALSYVRVHDNTSGEDAEVQVRISGTWVQISDTGMKTAECPADNFYIADEAVCGSTTYGCSDGKAGHSRIDSTNRCGGTTITSIDTREVEQANWYLAEQCQLFSCTPCDSTYDACRAQTVESLTQLSVKYGTSSGCCNRTYEYNIVRRIIEKWQHT